jgi:hypothetical protein
MNQNPPADGDLPGQPLDSGFVYRPLSFYPQLLLSDEACRELMEKEQSVAEALRRGVETGVGVYVQ